MEDPLIGFISEPFRHLIEREKNSKARSGCHSLLFPDDISCGEAGLLRVRGSQRRKRFPLSLFLALWGISDSCLFKRIFVDYEMPLWVLLDIELFFTVL